MTAPEESQSPAPTDRPRLPHQFSLWWLMVGVTVIALLLGLWSLIGEVVLWAVLTFVWYVVPMPLLITAFCGRGEVRTFSIGAVVPWVSGWLHGTSLFARYSLAGQYVSFVVAIGITAVVSAVCGMVAVRTRRWLEQRGWANPQ